MIFNTIIKCILFQSMCMHEREKKREKRSRYKQTFNVYKTKTILKLSILSHLNKESVSVAGHMN